MHQHGQAQCVGRSPAVSDLGHSRNRTRRVSVGQKLRGPGGVWGRERERGREGLGHSGAAAYVGEFASEARSLDLRHAFVVLEWDSVLACRSGKDSKQADFLSKPPTGATLS